MKTTTIIAAVTVASLSGAAMAHTGAMGIVLERMQGMSAMKEAVKTLTPMMRGVAEYDAEAVREAAQIIESHSGATMTELFPEDNANEKSYVKDSIWEKWEDFEQLALELETLSQGLAMAADNGIATEAADGADTAAMMGGESSTSTMMGGSSDNMMGNDANMGGLMGGTPAIASLEELAAMPADEVFADLSGVCSACHTRFRAERN